jgi:flagellar P-ring protein FlgI
MQTDEVAGARRWVRSSRGGRARLVSSAALFGILFLLTPPADAGRTQLRNICTVYGQKETPIIGIGLVVGLNHTGDGGKNAAAMRALASTLRYLNNPVQSSQELSDVTNVAMVAISATIPKEGASNGQRLDCYVTSTFGAKSLKGGRLLISPVRMPTVKDETVVGLASGPVVIEDADVQTAGRVPGGIILQRDFRTAFVDAAHGNKVTLVLDPAHATFGVASHVAEQINNQVYLVARTRNLASAVGPDRIVVRVPDLYKDDPVGFIAWILEVDVVNPQMEARVFVDTKSKTVVIHGDVQISPVIIAHKNLKVEVAGTTGEPAPFAPVSSQGQESDQQLNELLKGLQALKVSNDDVISIVRELYRSGNLHGVYEEH